MLRFVMTPCAFADVYRDGISGELVHPLATARLKSLQKVEAEKAVEHFHAATVLAQPEKYYSVHKAAFQVEFGLIDVAACSTVS